MSVRARQLLVVATGVVAAAVMIVLGLWQAQVFVDQGNRSASERAAQAPIPLEDFVHPDGTIGDVYGKRVVASGRYQGKQLAVVGEDGQVRVLTAFELADGRVLPVVRGVVPAGTALPPVSSADRERAEVSGLFLPSERGDDRVVAAGSYATVRLPQLAQQWTEQLTPGFVTLDEAAARAQGLTPATPVLPTEDGSWRNSGYAVQWWVFAAFALGMALKIAHTMGRREAAAREAAVVAANAPGADR